MHILKNEHFYFRAKVKKKNIVNFVALLRSIEDGLCFDRCFDKKNFIFEFFVTFGMRDIFLKIIKIFQEIGYVESFEEL